MRKSDAKILGEKIKEVRLARKFTQTQLAERASVSSSYIGSIEQGIRRPSLRVLGRLSKALKSSLRDFFPE